MCYILVVLISDLHNYYVIIVLCVSIGATAMCGYNFGVFLLSL